METSPSSSAAWNARRILACWYRGPEVAAASGCGAARRHAPASTLERERREVLEAVRGDLRRNTGDRNQLAACRYLLLHLAGRGRESATPTP